MAVNKCNKSSIAKKTFLSCLCGSEPNTLMLPFASFFLSCLCGSELSELSAITGATFLSCLCGSEHYDQDTRIKIAFLSCLCGSEPVTNLWMSAAAVSELPVWQ